MKIHLQKRSPRMLDSLLPVLALALCGTSVTAAPSSLAQEDHSGHAHAAQDAAGQSGNSRLLSVNAASHDFGTLAQGVVTEHLFQLEVGPGDPLALLEVKPSCGCTIAETSVLGSAGTRSPYEIGQKLVAGTKLELLARLNTAGKHDQVRTVVTLRTSDNRISQLELKAEVITFLKVSPERFHFGELQSDGEARGQLQVTNSYGDAYKLTVNKKRIPDYLQVELVPVKPDAAGRAKQWNVNLKIGPGVPEGRNRLLPVELISDYPMEGGEQSVNAAPAFHSVTAHAQVTVMAVVDATPHYMNFGSMTPGQVMQRTVLVESRDNEFDFVQPQPSIRGRRGDFEYPEAAVVQASPNVPGVSYKVMLTITAPSDLNGSFTGTVVVPVGHPKKNQIEVPFSGVVKNSALVQSGVRGKPIASVRPADQSTGKVVARDRSGAAERKSSWSPKSLDTGVDLGSLNATKNAAAEVGPPRPASVGKTTNSKLVPVGSAEHDFGDMTQGDVSDFAFSLRVEGEEPLTISELKKSCGCTRAEAMIVQPDGSKRLYSMGLPIDPGSVIEIQTSIDTKGKRNRFQSNVTVISTDPAGPLRLQLKAQVKTFLDIEADGKPQPTINFGQATTKSVLQGEMRITSGIADRFRVSLPQTLPEELKVDLVPLDPDENGLAPEWLAKVTLGPGIPERPGNNYRLNFVSDQVVEGATPGPNGEPQMHSVTGYVLVQVQGLVTFKPNYISFGRMVAGESAERVLDIHNSDPDFDLPLPVLTLGGLAPGSTFEHADKTELRVDTIEAGRHYRIVMGLKAPEGFTGALRGRIGVKLGHPDKDSQDISFTALVMPPSKPPGQ